MDTLTHCVAGGLTPLLFQRAPKRTALVVFGIFAGELPDIDAFFGNGTPEGLMVIHRGVTHALAFQPFLMLAYVVPFFIYLLWRHEKRASTLAPAGPLWRDISPGNKTYAPDGMGEPYGKDRTGEPYGKDRTGEAGRMGVLLPSLGLMCGMALFAQYIHIFLDSVTTFGTRIFLPFSPSRVDFPGMFIIDLFLLVPLIVLWVWALRATPAGESFWSRKSRYIARIAMAWLLLYPLANIGMNHALVAVYAKEHGVAKEQVTLFTEPFTPFVWKKVVWEGDWCTMQTVFPLHKDRPPVTVSYRVPDAALLETFTRDIPLFAMYRDFAPTLVLTEIVEGASLPGNKVYRFADVRYITSPQSPARSLGFSSTNFGFEVKTSHGRVVAYRYLDRLEEDNAPWVAVTPNSHAGDSPEKSCQTAYDGEKTVSETGNPVAPRG